MAQRKQPSLDTESTPRQTRAKKGAAARSAALTPERRAEIAKKASAARWAAPAVDGAELVITDAPPKPPVATYRGVLSLLDNEIPCYVLSNGQRVIGRTSVTEMLSGIKGGGNLETYVAAAPFRPYVPLAKLINSMVAFDLPEIAGLDRQAKGLPADILIDLCQGLVSALEASGRPETGVRLTDRQQQIAIKASMFLSACAKVGIDALIDEATGYQYQRAEDALQVKLRAYLEEEMRKWEPTFPEELWIEFARLTNWSGSVTKRPKYWGKLVMELIYEYLDKDVAQWLKDNAPTPRKGQNYHQWLSAQYGLKKLVEHIWKVVGMASACRTMPELRQRMAEVWGRKKLQFELRFPSTP